MHRFFLPAAEGTAAQDRRPGDLISFPTAIAAQMRNVLRLRTGARVIVLDDRGWEVEVELTELQGKRASGRVCEARLAQGEPQSTLTLYLALLKGQRFEWVLQKGTELGVGAFVPTLTRRTVVRDTGRMDRKRERWETIIREAAEQSRRGRLPRLYDPCSFADACRAAAESHDLALIPWVGAERPGLAEAVRAAKRAALARNVALLIGPEGGFEQAEVDLARQRGIQAVTLGPRTLRAETAALAAAAIVLSELGEMA